MNQPLQQRSGANVGNQPIALGAFLQASMAQEVSVPPNVRTVILEGVEGAVRSPLVGLEGDAQGLVYNPNTDDYDLTFYFVDAEGNSIELDSTTISSDSIDTYEFADGFEGLFTLCPGEKIEVLATVVSP